MIHLRFALIAALLSLAQPCEAALSVVTLGSAHGTAATTRALTTATNDCPIGSLIVAETANVTIIDTLSSVVDSAGNTWQTPIDNLSGTGIGIGWAYAVNSTVDLPIGGTITATFSGSTTSALSAVCIGGAATSSPLDVHNQSANGLAASSATTVNSGTLSQANEILLGGLNTATTSGTVTCGGSFTKTNAGASATPNPTICTLIVAATTSVAFSPTWTTSPNYITDLISFEAPGGVAATPGSPLTAIGVGP